MKRIIAIMLTALTIWTLSACGRAAGSPGPAVTDPVPAAVEETPADTASSDAEMPDSTPEAGAEAAFSPDFTFTTTDRAGNAYDESVFAGHKITIVNFWEPWCGPCVNEMPDLQKLYADYADKGLNIIGVYSTPGMEENVDSVLRSAGITFTILHYTDMFDAFETGYVPTTILVDGEGHIAGETLIGSRSYADWEAIISAYLS